jgi:hypothetical protein
MAIEFVVKSIINATGHKPHLVVRCLKPDQNFTITDKSLLNGVPIEPWVTSPRASTDNGEPRYDLFVFVPINSKDIFLFEKNTKVLLTNGSSYEKISFRF